VRGRAIAAWCLRALTQQYSECSHALRWRSILQTVESTLNAQITYSEGKLALAAGRRAIQYWVCTAVDQNTALARRAMKRAQTHS
jgi:hypothetical protein